MATRRWLWVGMGLLGTTGIGVAALFVPAMIPEHPAVTPEYGGRAAGVDSSAPLSIARGLRPVGVEAIGRDGQILRRGAGVVLSDSFLITAGHVARGCATLRVAGHTTQPVTSDAPALHLNDIVLVALPASASNPSASHQSVDSGGVAGALEAAFEAAVTPVPLAVSDRVMVSLHDAIVATTVLTNRSSFLFGSDCADLNLLTRPGHSGSPVFGLDGRLAGILVASSLGRTVCASISQKLLPQLEAESWQPLSAVSATIVTATERSLASVQPGDSRPAQTEGPHWVGCDEDTLWFLFAHYAHAGDRVSASDVLEHMKQHHASGTGHLSSTQTALLEMSLGKASEDDTLFAEGVAHLRDAAPWSALVRDTYAVFPSVARENMLTSWYQKVGEDDWYLAEAAAMVGDRAEVGNILRHMDELWWRYPPDVDILGLLLLQDGSRQEEEVERKLRDWPFDATNGAAREAGDIWRSMRLGGRREWIAANDLIDEWRSADPRREAYRLAQHAMCLWSLGRRDDVPAMVAAQLENGWWDERVTRGFAWLAQKACEPPELAGMAVAAIDPVRSSGVTDFGIVVMSFMESDEREAWVDEAATHVSKLPEGRRRQSAAEAVAAWRAAR